MTDAAPQPWTASIASPKKPNTGIRFDAFVTTRRMTVPRAGRRSWRNQNRARDDAGERASAAAMIEPRSGRRAGLYLSPSRQDGQADKAAFETSHRLMPTRGRHPKGELNSIPVPRGKRLRWCQRLSIEDVQRPNKRQLPFPIRIIPQAPVFRIVDDPRVRLA